MAERIHELYRATAERLRDFNEVERSQIGRASCRERV